MFRYVEKLTDGSTMLREFDQERWPVGEEPAGVTPVATDEQWAALQQAQKPATVYIPFPLICGRLRDMGKWDAFATLYSSLTPAQQLHLQTLEQGVAPDDAEFIAGLQSIGADPAVVLKP